MSALTPLSVKRAVFGAPVNLGNVPGMVADPVIDTRFLQANHREALLRIDRVGRFHVRDGRRVVVDPATDTPASMLDTWLDGTVAALVLLQQRRFALHASTVRLNGSLVAMSGTSGIGKSTTVGLLAARGHPMVTDDLTAVDTSAEGELVVRSSGRRLRLWPDAMLRLGYDAREGRQVAPDTEKRSFPIAPSPGADRLGLVVALRVNRHITSPATRRLSVMEAVAVLANDTYRPLLCTLQPGSHLRWMARIAATVPVVRLDRPADGWSGEDVATAIEQAASATPRAGSQASGLVAAYRTAAPTGLVSG